ncbi:inositol monophosphatase family protein [Desulfallas thermosapovorans]|uniref:Inositol-1-monophosphatase n=1 Tax=Desulfallas thermosapovorans DSM 6562 TaxID=1121431 RepID=A0A5S4ZNN5_9FIRM|nr:inositol monophosphatase family protein [Desulfallas thermosapovorans]TYO94436.1 myo-inositol-1(or 4)-monophosphatase [Desulfallas thermosapovorans DSM 6562]
MNRLQAELEVAVRAAREAGQLIKDKIYRHSITETKSCLSDLVTEVDRQAEAGITGLIRRHFPGHAVVGEEQQGNYTGEPGGNITWYIDPLDGTTNFVFGLPFCAVSIAMAEHGIPVLGVIHDPLREETFTAVRGDGARLNGSPINTDKSIATLDQSLLVTGYPGNINNRPRMHRVNYKEVIDRCNNLRALGSAALELAYIASGRLTGFWEVSLKPWDVAAGMVLVKEAGGEVSNLTGQPLLLTENVDIAATNGLIHRELLECLAWREDSPLE